MRRADWLEKTLMLGKIEGRRRRDDRGWDGWMASPTKWTWVWVDSGSWWWTGRPGVLWFMGSQRVGHNWVTELNWTITLFTIQNWWLILKGKLVTQDEIKMFSGWQSSRGNTLQKQEPRYPKEDYIHSFIHSYLRSIIYTYYLSCARHYFRGFIIIKSLNPHDNPRSCL